MRLQFAPALARVRLDDLGAVQIQSEEGIDSNEDNAGVCVDETLGISVENGVKDCSVRKSR